MENLSFQYPVWFFLVCILGAAIFSGLLYHRDTKFSDRSAFQTRALAGLRFLTIAIGAILLMGPYIKTIQEDTRLPVIAVLSDNSESVGTWLGAEGIETYKSGLKSLNQGLSEKFIVQHYAFGEGVRRLDSDSLRFTEQLTDINSALQYVDDIYEGGNLGAVVLATDGIYNDGRNPVYSAFSLNAPIYAVSLGDTTRKKDLLIKNVFHNEIAYLNDLIQLEIDIEAFNGRGEFSRLILEKEEQGQFNRITTRDININNNEFFITLDLQQELNAPGIAQFRVRVVPISNESNLNNNTKDIFIEVLDARQSILIQANAPHPDIAAMRQLLEANKNYEVSVDFGIPNVSRLNEKDLVIFHNLPSARKDIGPLIGYLDQNKIPRMYVLGTQTNIARFNQLQSDVRIQAQTTATNDVQAVAEGEFNYFVLDPNVLQRTQQYPPLQAVFGQFTVTPRVRTLLRQRIGAVNTDYPLLSFVDNSGVKTAFLFGEGIWRWKLFDFMQDGSFMHIGSLLDNAIVYTSTVEDKRKFRVATTQKLFNENADIAFVGELYNNSYQLVNEPDVFLKVNNQDAETFDFTFSKKGKSYILNTGRFSPGRYTYRAQTSYDNVAYASEGSFTVGAISYELADTEANYNDLYALTKRYGGNVFDFNSMDALQEEIQSNNALKPVMYQTATSKPLIDFKWLFWIFALLLGGEWLMRRYLGRI